MKTKMKILKKGIKKKQVQKQVKKKKTNKTLKNNQQSNLDEEMVQNDSVNFEMMTYELDEPDWCYSIIINQLSDLVFVSTDEKGIKQFTLTNGELNFIECLTQIDQTPQTVLKFINNDTAFISGSKEGQICIWSPNEGKWTCQTTLENSHTKFIKFLHLNKNDHQLFSGSLDQSIKIWIKETEWKCINTIVLEYSPDSFSLNETEDMFIVYANNVIVFQLNQDKWQKKQLINVDQEGYGSCFISNNMFVFQPIFKNLQVYHLNEQNQLFEKQEEVEVYNSCEQQQVLSPMRYNQEKQLLFDIYGDTINFIKNDSGKNFKVALVIDEFDDQPVVAALTSDWKTLITWSYYTCTYQIRQAK